MPGGAAAATLRAGEELPSVLRLGSELLSPLRTAHSAAAHALDRLERDLLPRTADGAPYVIAGIVGPNNAGKSALFNALVGYTLSPSVPTGGATRRLIGAAHPDLLTRLTREPTLARFRLRPLPTGERTASAALQPSRDPAELLVAAEAHLPPTLMLIDTPDFDSILADNRLASESLLAVADVVVVVVTRHTYQNREVVRFLDGWLDHGRPWMLVYNEAIDTAVASAHATKLADDVGSVPLAAFWAPHCVAIQQGAAVLEPRRLALAGDAGMPAWTGVASPGDARLRDVLFHLDAINEIKTRAFAASLTHLRRDVDALAAGLSADAQAARDVLAAATARAEHAGVQIASGAMPGGPFIEAFRRVLDRRSNPLSRSWRYVLRQVRVGLESLPRLLLGGATRNNPGPPLAEIERQQLTQYWPSFWEEIVRDLGAEGRHRARASAGPAVADWLDTDLAPGKRAEAQARAAQALAAATPDYEAFRDECERLIESAVEERGFDFDIQALADVATLAPLAVATAVIVKTGGLGSDIAAAGGGAVGTYLMEKYTHLLGSGLTAAARERWTEQRGRQLATILVDAALAQSAPALRARVEEDTRSAAALRAWSQALT